jgi:hypothetical protein
LFCEQIEIRSQKDEGRLKADSIDFERERVNKAKGEGRVSGLKSVSAIAFVNTC